jgi:hypothetical protein
MNFMKEMRIKNYDISNFTPLSRVSTFCTDTVYTPRVFAIAVANNNLQWSVQRQATYNDIMRKNYRFLFVDTVF